MNGLGANPLPAAKPLLAVSDLQLLRQLESAGLDVATTAEFGPRPESPPNNAELHAHASYRELVAVLQDDLAEFEAKDPLLGIGMKYAHRAFDAGWLSRPDFRFELSGIVNRIDRKDFAPETCGEVRFLYRLAYTVQVDGQTIHSRVPMTMNVVRWLPRDERDCQDEARRWHLDVTGPDARNALLSSTGPLAQLTTRTHLKSVEVNLQNARWPSTVRPNMAGHAEYLMRVFTRDGAHLKPATLENTPDVARLRSNPDLQARLRHWLQRPEVLRALDRGTVLLPQEFLARRALSVAPHGMAREANRPFTQALQTQDLGPLISIEPQTFAGKSSLLRRLDGLSCPGCHQTRSIAGFHFLGDDDSSRRADVIAVPHSPHFGDELERRLTYNTALAAGHDADSRRAPVERMAGGGYGAHCGLDATGEFGKWTCDPGLTCVAVTSPDVGTCMPTTPGPGDVCEVGRMRANVDRRRDYVALRSPASCGSGHCESNSVGFPGGMCSTGCGKLEATAACGGIAQLVEFNSCLARRVPFEQCILDNSRPGALRACSLSAPCREDYICARLPQGGGGCIPPYFLFQMRVDGHVLP